MLLIELNWPAKFNEEQFRIGLAELLNALPGAWPFEGPMLIGWLFGDRFCRSFVRLFDSIRPLLAGLFGRLSRCSSRFFRFDVLN